LKGASWELEREGFLKNVYATIDEIAPGFSDGIIDQQVLLPPDIERIINSPHGHIFHGELALEQLFFQRPAPHYADYRSPIRGLYQCGSSTHPGGGVSGIPGHNAARRILQDWKSLSRLGAGVASAGGSGSTGRAITLANWSMRVAIDSSTCA
jgi:phytoene dehydrogenase-like protein